MSNAALKPIVVIGGGGHASVLVDILRMQQRDIIAVVSPDELSLRAAFQGLVHFRNDDDVLKFSPEEVLLVNGIGVLPSSGLKRKLNQCYLSHGYQFETVIANNAQVSPYAQIEAGSQVFAGAIIQAGVKIASHSIINSGVIIEHDSSIGAYNHIAPRATLCGQVQTADNVYVGSNATIIQNVKLAKNTIVGAGSTIVKNLDENIIAYCRCSLEKKLYKNDK